MRRHFKQGEILFRQGDPSDFVLRIDTGSVEILREVGGDTSVVLGTVAAGQFVGEMGVIEKRLRNATARASTEVEAEQFSAEEFFQRASADPAMAHELMLRLSIRLREIEDKVADDLPLVQAMAESSAALQQRAPGGPLRLELAADTIPLRERLGSHPIRVDQFPFVVGREAYIGERIPRRAPDLLLWDREPFRISRQHFMIATGRTGLVVRDLNSALGTTVNGQSIGSHFRTDIAELRPGQNRVIAGGIGSDFAFTAFVH